MRHPQPTPDPPAAIGSIDGLAYSLWLPEPAAAGAGAEPWAGIVVLHGAGSVKESHHDFARAARAAGAACVCFDARGHGASGGRLDGRALDDVATAASVLPPGLPIVLRGSSMGGCLAVLAATRAGAAAVIAICPAGPQGLLRSLRSGRLPFAADDRALGALLADADLEAAAAGLAVPLLLLHAEGDEIVPVAQSRALAALAADAKLVAVPGGHHRSVQHDEELQGESLRWARRALSRAVG